jgi:hypothetical protein
LKIARKIVRAAAGKLPGIEGKPDFPGKIVDRGLSINRIDFPYGS